MTRSRAQIKVNRIDTSEPPKLRLHLSILTVRGDHVVPMTNPVELEQLELLVAEGDEKDPRSILTIVKGEQTAGSTVSETRSPPLAVAP